MIFAIQSLTWAFADQRFIFILLYCTHTKNKHLFFVEAKMRWRHEKDKHQISKLVNSGREVFEIDKMADQ